MRIAAIRKPTLMRIVDPAMTKAHVYEPPEPAMTQPAAGAGHHNGINALCIVVAHTRNKNRRELAREHQPQTLWKIALVDKQTHHDLLRGECVRVWDVAYATNRRESDECAAAESKDGRHDQQRDEAVRQREEEDRGAIDNHEDHKYGKSLRFHGVGKSLVIWRCLIWKISVKKHNTYPNCNASDC